MNHLKQYKDRKATLERQNKFNKEHYRRFGLLFDREKDGDLISELEKSSNKTETVRAWFKKYKGG